MGRMWLQALLLLIGIALLRLLPRRVIVRVGQFLPSAECGEREYSLSMPRSGG